MGVDAAHFWLSLILLGLGWNFGFVGASALELRRKAIDEGMITLRRSGLLKVMDGVTTIEEVARETVK